MGSETKPSLRTMASNVQACLDEMLPDHFRNAASGSFQQHLVAQKEKVPAQKATWKGGLNYLFESLKMHREWYGRNQQYVQLKKEEKRLEAHVVTLRSIISSSLSTLELEVGLREAELKGRVGAYKVMFEVSRVASALSRPAVKLHVHKPDDSSISVFCDTFVLDIHLTGGNGDVHSASLTTVVNEVTKQHPERDADLLSCLLELISGRSERFTEKLRRLVNRAELAAKFPSTNFDDLEDDLQEKLQLVCAKQNLWTVRRGVDGLLLTFRDGLQCFPSMDTDDAAPPQKKAKLSGDAGQSTSDGDDDTVPSNTTSAPWTSWQGCLTFAEWKGAVALHFVCDTPLVMSGIQSRRLASTIFGLDDQEVAFNELVQDTVAHTSAANAVVRFQPQLRFVRDVSTNVILQRALPAVLEGTLVTKEIVGGIQFEAFPIPLIRGTGEVLGQLLAVVGHSLFFHSVLASFFAGSSTKNVFGRRDLSTDASSSMIQTHVQAQVEVSAPKSITLKLSSDAMSRDALVEVTTHENCSLDLAVRTTNKATGVADADHDSEDTQQLAQACHSLPLLTYFVCQPLLLSHRSASDTTAAAASASHRQHPEIVTIDDDDDDQDGNDDMGAGMSLDDGNDIVLDDDSFF